MNFLHALQLLPLMSAPTEGSSSPAEPASTTTPPTTESSSLLSEGVPPPPAEAEGGEGAAAPEPAAPLTRDALTLPEGFADAVLETVGEGDDAKQVTALDRALDVMNDAALSPKERFEKLVELQSTLVQRSVAEAEAAWTGMQNQWRQEAQALPEIGGAKLPETLAAIKKGLDVSGADTAFYEAMALTGAGNNPHVIRVLHALTKPLSEGKPVLGTPPKGPLSIEAKLYPTMMPKE